MFGKDRIKSDKIKNILKTIKEVNEKMIEEVRKNIKSGIFRKKEHYSK